MSSQAANELGQNAVMCYFPWLPYYLRYHIGFDILVNTRDAQGDPSVAGQSPHLIHVQLHFPDGFLCNPANFDELPHPLFFLGGEQDVYPPHPHFNPPVYPDYLHATSPLNHLAQMFFHRVMMCQGQFDTRVVVRVVNGQPGEFMAIDDTLYGAIPQCKECGEFHREPEHVHNRRPQCGRKRKRSKQSHKQPGRTHQHHSKSGITGQRDTPYPPRPTCSESVATDPRNHLQNQDEPTLIHQMAGEDSHGLPEKME
ncbi:uncharacterized protein LOC126471608 isoform X1 [Schistocerca serialis cubense]|uniref:uncharacterized protein LOC126471608 isoform X1 n=1 Tax=Schistocerca serialis cubense TaxID=2023355 RepID=UPI00214EB0A7|nr:uncharacterized protein LOC126471608 isoform X1 [Schistocerca serialis cubense]